MKTKPSCEQAQTPPPVTRAEVIVNPGNTVVQGTMIQAVTETALDSTLPGAIRAIVSEDVHSFDGTRVLIPRGARLVGRYRSDVALAQSRVMVAWDRIILPDNQTVEISAFGGDELGRTGTTGFVDTRFAQRFGSAALISLIGALARRGRRTDRGRGGSRCRKRCRSTTCATAPKA
jgi:type IV secretion system protein VirB10